ncbi:hypothetical protein GCM10017044_23500 [Kordiimonas sediminis]|uniref:DUF2066 domain-containing protein n=1 Tax=Kordiimonas sediminis TaxID=1735581 RepID=A0A919AV78_9PROT|nr:hypothetical protein [Kordiimonas sediminis]GHF27703.1 hypothetical protein GCM10017044_23500 [Kordiimonas sediminis]
MFHFLRLDFLRKLSFLASVLAASLFACVTIAPIAQAQAVNTSLDTLFTVRNLQLDETASSAFQARSAAIEKAESEAFDILLSKIIRQSDKDKLPPLSRREKQTLMVGIDFLDEKTSSRRYLATVNIRFEPALVSELLDTYNIPHILEAGGRLMILHAHTRGVKNILWEDDTTLEKARAAVDWSNRIRQPILLESSHNARMNFPFKAVSSIDHRTIASRLRNFNMPSALLISSSITRDYKSVTSRLTYKYGTTRAGGITEDHIQVPGVTLESEETALIKMYRNILDDIDERWKAQLLVDTDITGSITLIIATPALKDFINLTDRIAGISLITKHQVVSVKVPVSILEIEYKGTESQLELALGYAGLELVNTVDGKMLQLANQ